MQHLPNSKQGSALLLTILVVSLMMVMVLSYTVYVRMELRAVQNRIDQLRAQQNAKLALNLALDKLRVTTGPDQRVTARAEILGTVNASNGNKFWTGVWTHNLAGGVNSSPSWLVSGTSPDPTIALGADSYEIFPAINSDPAVRVPLQDIPGESGSKAGELAFWVADEGVKASVAARRNAVVTFEDAALKPERRSVEYQTDFGVDLEPLFQSPSVELTDTDLPPRLERATFADDFILAEDSAGTRFSGTSTDLSLHDLTTVAYGVFEDSANGGLKTNLSDLEPDVDDEDAYLGGTYDDGFLNTQQTRKFLNPDKSGVLEVEYGDPASEGIAAGDPYFSPRPLLTEAVLYIGLFHTWSDAKLRIRFHVQAEFLNPYSLPMEFPSDTDGGYDRGVVLVFNNLPTITVEDKSGVGPTISEDLNNFSSYSSTDYRRYINSWVDVAPNGTANVPRLEPGETYQVMEPDPGPQPRGLARDFGTVRWSGNQNTRPADTASIEISAPSANVTLDMVPFKYWASSTPADYKLRDKMFSIQNVPFQGFTIRKTFNSGPNPFSRSTSSSYLVDDYNLAYHFRFWSDETDTGSVRDLFSKADFLGPIYNLNESFMDLNGQNRSAGELLDPISDVPPQIVQDTLNLFSDLDVFRDLTARSHNQDYRRLALLDVPDSEVMSVGQLTSLPIYKQPPHLIGSPWGGDYNEAFDRYYFSPKATHPTSGDPMLLNPSVIHLEDPESGAAGPGEYAHVQDAGQELSVGQFNINSTSTAAWEAVLSAPVLTPRAENEPPGGDLARTGTFLRQPQFQAANPEFVVRDGNLADPEEHLKDPEWAFSQGIRALHDAAGRQQIRSIANRIVTSLKSRAEPFPDLKTFVNSGILQDAIDNATDDSGVGINEDLFEYSNVYLRQNDILSKLAPVASTRSDTFKIRAYGSYMNPATGDLISKASCEAVVQRIPRKLDGSNPSSAAGFLDMRDFRIISFRWLTHEES